MTAKESNKSKAGNPHIEAAQRIRQLAHILSEDPAEARAFREKTGVFTASGELKEPYR